LGIAGLATRATEFPAAGLRRVLWAILIRRCAGQFPACGRSTWRIGSREHDAERTFLALLMETHLVISAIGGDHPGIVDQLSRSVLDCGCHIGDSRMAVLGGEFALIMEVSGNWNAVAKLESALPRLAEKLDLRVQSKRTEPRRGTDKLIPYAVEVVAFDHPGIVQEVANFFARREINIEDVYTSRYPAPQTGAPMFSLHMTVGIPADTSIAAVRGEFMDFCDDLNLDAMLAPVK
jgi:glycine cleavage system transcriptional repressor